HQLRALGIGRTLVLLPWDRTAGCTPPEEGRMHAVFGVAPPEETREPTRPRLGVALARGEAAGARIEQVEAGSVAAEAGLRAGDVVVAIAGGEVRRNEDVIAAVQRQPAGTWLPMRVRRGDAELELVAKFPAR